MVMNMLAIPTIPTVDDPPGADEMAALLGVTREQLAALFVGTGELMALWKISKQTLHDLGRRHADWPTPVATLKGGSIYAVGDIRRYALAHQREVPGDTALDQGNSE